MKALFKNKSFFLLFQGSLVSSIGTSLYGFAAGIYIMTLFPQAIYQNSGAFYFAIVSAAPIVTRLIISPIAGALVDKWNRIRIIYLTDFINGFLFLISLFILIRFDLTIYQQVLLFTTIGGLAGINSAFFGPAVQSSIPDIVGDHLIQAANGAQSIVASIQGIIGVLAGVILFELLGIEVAILANGLSFILSGISEMFIKTKYLHPRQPSNKSIITDIKVGFSYVKTTTGLSEMMKYLLLINFAFVPLFSVGIPFLFKTELAKSGYHLAASSIVFSITMLFAGIYIGSKKMSSIRKSLVSSLPKMVLVYTSIVAIIFAVTYQIFEYWIFFGLYLLASVMMAYYSNCVNIPLNTALIKGIDPSYRGRVLSVIQSLAGAAMPVSMILGGVVIRYSNVAFLGLLCVFALLLPLYGITKNHKVLTFLDSLDDRQILNLQPNAS
jgi:MFS family permease